MKQLNELYSTQLDHVRKTNEIIGSLNKKFEDDGTIIMGEDATVWDDLRVEPSIKAAGSHDPAFQKWYDNGSGSIGLWLFNFTNVIAANEKEVFFTMQMPHGWKGTDIYPHVHWVHDSNQNNASVRWGLEYTWGDIGTVLGNSTIIYSSTKYPNDANLVINKHYITPFPSITPSVSQNGVSSILIGRVFRNSSHADDTSTGIAGLLYIDAHFELDTIGSRTEMVK